MGWKTYLIMYFGTQGVKSSDVSERVEDLGFESVIGSVDFVYDWKGKKPSKGEILSLGDKVVEVLDGSGAIFNLDTHD